MKVSRIFSAFLLLSLMPLVRPTGSDPERLVRICLLHPALNLTSESMARFSGRRLGVWTAGLGRVVVSAILIAPNPRSTLPDGRHLFYGSGSLEWSLECKQPGNFLGLPRFTVTDLAAYAVSKAPDLIAGN